MKYEERNKNDLLARKWAKIASMAKAFSEAYTALAEAEKATQTALASGMDEESIFNYEENEVKAFSEIARLKHSRQDVIRLAKWMLK